MTESFTSSSTLAGPGGPPTASPLTVSVRTLGCKVNRVDSERIAAELLGANIEIAEETQAAVVIVNTCAVTGEAEAKARKAVRHAAGLPQRPTVVVTGCVSAIAADAMRALADNVLVESDKTVIAARVMEMLGVKRDARPATRVGPAFHTRAMVKIEDGCDAYCSYCIVPYARGNPVSVPLAEVVEEVQALVAAGVPEVVLTGINIGRYRDGSADLAAVIEAVAGIGVPRIRLSSVEPQDLTDRLLDVLSGTPAMLPHLHVPLQSGSDAVLRAMERSYTSAAFAERIAAVRECVPDVALTTDVIAGFPTETEADAAATDELCERIGFAKLHVFRYSTRSGTAASRLNPLPPEVVASRAAELRELGDRLRTRYLESRRGHVAGVLIEEIRDGWASGTTGDYLKVAVQAPDLRVGEVVRVLLGGREGDTLVGTAAEQGIDAHA